jgi:hypothetical protein
VAFDELVDEADRETLLSCLWAKTVTRTQLRLARVQCRIPMRRSDVVFLRLQREVRLQWIGGIRYAMGEYCGPEQIESGEVELNIE